MKFLYVYVLTIILATDSRPTNAKDLEKRARDELKIMCKEYLDESYVGLKPVKLQSIDHKEIFDWWKNTKTVAEKSEYSKNADNKKIITWIEVENNQETHREGKNKILIDYLNSLKQTAQDDVRIAETNYNEVQSSKFCNLPSWEWKLTKDKDHKNFKKWYEDKDKQRYEKYTKMIDDGTSQIVQWLTVEEPSEKLVVKNRAQILNDYLLFVLDEAKKGLKGAESDFEDMSDVTGIGKYEYYNPKPNDCEQNLFHTRTFSGKELKTRGENQVRVMHWNILADGLAGSGLALKQYSKSLEKQFSSPKECLIWEYRMWLILEEIAHYEPDIITLVELDANQDFQGKDNRKESDPLKSKEATLQYWLEKIGYDYVYKAKKQKFAEQGTGIFWKRDKLKVVEFVSEIVGDNGEKRQLLWEQFSKETGGQIFSLIRFELVKTKLKLAVCTVHLQSDKDQEGENKRAIQISEALDFLNYESNTKKLNATWVIMDVDKSEKFTRKKDLVKENIMENYPVIITGDFNAERTMSLSAKGEVVQPLAVSVPLSNGFKNFYQEILGGDLPWTSWKKRPAGRTDKYAIDYVFGSDKTKGYAVLGEIDDKHIETEILLPNYQSGSDHISLVVDFEVMEKSRVSPAPPTVSIVTWGLIVTIAVLLFTILYLRFAGPEKPHSRTQSQAASVD